MSIGEKIVGWALQVLGAAFALFWAAFIYDCYMANILDPNIAAQAVFCGLVGLYAFWAGRWGMWG